MENPVTKTFSSNKLKIGMIYKLYNHQMSLMPNCNLKTNLVLTHSYLRKHEDRKAPNKTNVKLLCSPIALTLRSQNTYSAVVIRLLTIRTWHVMFPVDKKTLRAIKSVTLECTLYNFTEC